LTIVALLSLIIMGTLTTRGAAPKHPIGVRMVKGKAELYDRKTSKRFVVRGVNYVRLADLKKSDGTMLLYHSTFNPGYYDPARVQVDMQAIAKSRYNVIRVFFNAATTGGIISKADSLSDDYLKNFVDFLKKAKENKLFVIPTIDWIPIPPPGTPPGPMWCSDYQCGNVQYLTADGIRANQVFFTRLVTGLVTLKAATDMILAYELRNELIFESDLPPLSLTTGNITPANGKQYDLGSAAEKSRMIEEGLTLWINKMCETVNALDPTALVSVGFIPPKAPHPTRVAETKVSVVGPVIRKSRLDIVDIHVYPEAGGLTMSQYAENFGIVGFTAKPVIMGEYGALTDQYPSREAAMEKMADLQAASAGLGISGWIYWAWHIEKNPDTYNLADEGAIVNRALAPAYHPDPGSRAIAAKVRKNRTSGAKASATGTFESFGPECAIDRTARPWNSGGEAPQWIELDLQQPDSVQMIRLVVSQSPAGETVHQILARTGDEAYRLIKELRGETKDKEVIEVPTPGLVNVRYIKVLTLKSPSWVGWREIEVIRPSAR
jgi:hypothetical protein